MSNPSIPTRVVIVANGPLIDLAPFKPLLSTAQLIMAADGGARTLAAYGVSPQLIIGDMDSLPAADLRAFHEHGGRSLSFPAEKDETDLELALLHACDLGAQEITILGAIGGRLDQELGNLFLLAHPRLRPLTCTILEQRTRVMAIFPERPVHLGGKADDLLSLLPLTQQASGISTEGLKYALNSDALVLGPARGISNVFLSSRAHIRLTAGILLAIHSWTDERSHHWLNG